MSDRFLNYLRRELSRLQDLIDGEAARPVPDRLLLARLGKLKARVRDQISEIENEASDRRAA